MDIFGGCIGRGSYWLVIVLLYVGGFLFGLAGASLLALPLGLIGLLVCAARARDIDKSGWLSLLTLIPIAGLVAVIWLGCMPSEPEFPTQPPPTE